MAPPCLLSILLLLMLCSLGASFRICAFNAQRFAQGKVEKAHVMDIFVKILARCDIAVLQEVMDAKGKAIPALAAALNQFENGADIYSYITSPLLGRSNYQERYVFFYRTRVLDSYKYEDEHPERPDVFAREPFIVRFSLPNKGKGSENIRSYFSISGFGNCDDMIFLGDFNADCGYVAKKRWGNIRLRQKPEFHWLIGDKADTTVRENTRCAYDRNALSVTPLCTTVWKNTVLIDMWHISTERVKQAMMWNWRDMTMCQA
uniref:Deoxyribonuclease n=1 Tax=Anolis carolinensis TaxID=28377 RepID=G1KHG5_ANOCA